MKICMKNLFVAIAVVVASACGNGQQAKATENKKDGTEVFYFHGKQQCITCKKIQALTEEVVKESFAKELKDGKLVFQVIDISTDEGEKLADQYEVTWASLFVNKWKDSKEIRNNLTDMAFKNAVSKPEAFKTELKKKIEEMLK